jgi:hypothetical protein
MARTGRPPPVCGHVTAALAEVSKAAAQSAQRVLASVHARRMEVNYFNYHRVGTLKILRC